MKRWKFTPGKLAAVGFIGFMVTAGSFSFGIFFLSLCYIGLIWEDIQKKNKKRSRHGARP